MTRELAERLRREHTLGPYAYRWVRDGCEVVRFGYVRAAAG